MELKFRVAEDAVRLRFEIGGSVPAPEPVSGDNSVHGSVDRIIVNAGAFAGDCICGSVDRIIVNAGAFAEDCICGIAERIEEG